MTDHDISKDNQEDTDFTLPTRLDYIREDSECCQLFTLPEEECCNLIDVVPKAEMNSITQAVPSINPKGRQLPKPSIKKKKKKKN